jgi:hypothetical protein
MTTMPRAPRASTIQRQEVSLGEGGQPQLPEQPGLPQRRPLARHVEDQALEALVRAVLKRITLQGRLKWRIRRKR